MWEGLQGRQAPAAHWSVAVLIALAAVAAVVAGWRHQHLRGGQWLASTGRAIRHWRRRPAYAAGVVAWVVLVLAVVGWDLNSFVHQAHELPTLSYLFGRVTRWWWGRAIVFGLWLAAGVGLVAGCRRAGRTR